MDQQYEKSKLSEQIKNDYVDAAKHLVFGMALTSEELYPVGYLYKGIFVQKPGRITKRGFCEVLDLELCELDGGWQNTGSALITGAVFDENTERWGTLRAQWSELIKENTLPTLDLWPSSNTALRPSVVAEMTGEGDPLSCTIVNDELWEAYLWAVAKLTETPDEFGYEQEDMSILMEGMVGTELYASGKKVTVIDAYADEQVDVSIRGFYFAKYVVDYLKLADYRDEKQLKRFAVVFQEWEDGQQSYNCYRRNDDDVYEWIDGGYNYFADLHACREYIVE